MAEQPEIRHILWPVAIMVILLAIGVLFSVQIRDYMTDWRSSQTEQLFPRATVAKEEVVYMPQLYIDSSDPATTKLFKFLKYFDKDYSHYIPISTCNEPSCSSISIKMASPTNCNVSLCWGPSCPGADGILLGNYFFGGIFQKDINLPVSPPELFLKLTGENCYDGWVIDHFNITVNDQIVASKFAIGADGNCTFGEQQKSLFGKTYCSLRSCDKATACTAFADPVRVVYRTFTMNLDGQYSASQLAGNASAGVQEWLTVKTAPHATTLQRLFGLGECGTYTYQTDDTTRNADKVLCPEQVQWPYHSVKYYCQEDETCVGSRTCARDVSCPPLFNCVDSTKNYCCFLGYTWNTNTRKCEFVPTAPATSSSSLPDDCSTTGLPLNNVYWSCPNDKCSGTMKIGVAFDNNQPIITLCG